MTLQMEASIPHTKKSGLIIETARLVMRAPSKRDLDGLVKLANNINVAQMMGSLPHPFTRSDAERLIERARVMPGGYMFAVFAKAEQRTLIGTAGFGKSREIPSMGFWLGEPYWGKGYATEAARAMIDHVFSETAYDVLSASCRIQNEASRRVIEKCGFAWESTRLAQIRSLGASVPVDRFLLERKTWESLRAWGATALPTFTKAG